MSDSVFERMLRALFKQQEDGEFKKGIDYEKLHKDSGQPGFFHGATEREREQARLTIKRVNDDDPRLWKLRPLTLFKIRAIMKIEEMTLDQIIASFSTEWAREQGLQKPHQEEFRRKFMEKSKEKPQGESVEPGPC